MQILERKIHESLVNRNVRNSFRQKFVEKKGNILGGKYCSVFDCVLYANPRYPLLAIANCKTLG